jgi:hypothetical protein
MSASMVLQVSICLFVPSVAASIMSIQSIIPQQTTWT